MRIARERRMSGWHGRVAAAMVIGAGISGVAVAQPAGVAEWRGQHERAIVEELSTLVAIPNVAGNDADMRRNADHLAGLFKRRGFAVETIGGPGSPVVFASLDAAKAVGTLTFYIHYDGQPVDPAEWTRCKPFTPCLWSANGAVAVNPARTSFDPEWRMYGRSTSDDKGPIVALLNAVEALKATGGGPTWNVRVVLDGEEEAGSANFRRFAAARSAALKTDLAVTLDGPRHPSGRPTVYFGVRGGAGVTLTVYGAKGDVHSGNYGNWAPDPSMRLARLLASMKDDTGRVLIKDFYRDVRPLTATERQALDAAPNVEAVLQRDFGVARPERPDQRLEVKLNEPTLSVLELSTSGIPGRSAIPGAATARIEVRMVKDLVPETQNALITEHVRAQGYHVISGREPSDDERRQHPLIARVDARRGSAASRVSMDDPKAQAVVKALTMRGVPPVQLPTLGGGLPFGTFSDQYQMPTVGVSIVNFDNNQHGPDENLRLQNLWEGIEMLASLMTMPAVK
jgi:acetylornithine deacetylase/succinyl-diaminopimelate desuccinylase-like protein